MSIQRRGVLSQDQRIMRERIHELMREHGIKIKDIAVARRLKPDGPRQLTQVQKVRLSQVVQLMEYWNITPREIGKPTLPTRVTTAYVKYRHPEHRELSWDGQGDHPEWLRTALLKQGYRVDELKPENQAA